MKKSPLLFFAIIFMLSSCGREELNDIPIIENQFIRLNYIDGTTVEYQGVPFLESNSYYSNSLSQLVLHRHLPDDSENVIILGLFENMPLKVSSRGAVELSDLTFPFIIDNSIVARFPRGISEADYDCEQNSFYELKINEWTDEFIMKGEFYISPAIEPMFTETCLNSLEAPIDGSFVLYVQPYEP